MAHFIQVTLDDFEEQFSMPSKKDPSRRAFNLTRPNDSEAFYTCVLDERQQGRMVIKLLTTIRGDRVKARGCGEDAIRCFMVWEDIEGWTSVIGRTNRTYRSGGKDATAADVVARALKKARDVAKEKVPACPDCGRPMLLRKVKEGDRAGQTFWGCCAFKEERCKGTKPS
jgi:hypothetical protein